jgi:hypothetical protein
MYSLEITIQRKAGGSWPVVVEQHASGVFLPVRDEGALELDLVDLRRRTTPKDYGTTLVPSPVPQRRARCLCAGACGQR